jgi:hypothetical protein
MSTKKVSYKNLLKQAISEFDTSKTVQVKGPMLDPILSWDGDGEIPIYKDAASILERYYFNENAEDPIMVSDFQDVQEMEYNEDGTEAKTSSMKHGEGPGTQQAGTSKASNIKGDLKDQEEDIAKEDTTVTPEKGEEAVVEDDDLASDLELFFSEQEEEEAPAEGEEEEEEDLDVDEKMGEKEGEEKAEKDEKDKEVKEDVNVLEDAENAVIEKLIDEMEELEEVETTYTGEGPKDSSKKVMTYDKEGPAPGMEAPDEKKASGPEEDTKGAGTDQAGTGPAEGQIPPRKDEHDAMVKPKNYSEGKKDIMDMDADEILEALSEDDDAEALEEKEWNDKDLPKKKVYHDESAPNGLGRIAKGQPDMDNEEPYNEQYMKESFEIFKEAIKDEEEDDDDNIVV